MNMKDFGVGPNKGINEMLEEITTKMNASEPLTVVVKDSKGVIVFSETTRNLVMLHSASNDSTGCFQHGSGTMHYIMVKSALGHMIEEDPGIVDLADAYLMAKAFSEGDHDFIKKLMRKGNTGMRSPGTHNCDSCEIYDVCDLSIKKERKQGE